MGKFRLGGQAGCHLVPGRQAWAPPDQLLPQRYLYPLLQNVLRGRAQAQKRGAPLAGFLLISLPPHPCSSPSQDCRQRRGPEAEGRASPAPSAARQALSPNGGGGSNQGEGERQGRRLLHTKCSLKDGRALPSPPSSRQPCSVAQGQPGSQNVPFLHAEAAPPAASLGGLRRHGRKEGIRGQGEQGVI